MLTRIPILIALMVLIATSGPALAARYTPGKIHLKDAHVLFTAGGSDDGELDADAVWQKLKTLEFTVEGYNVSIVPDEGKPLQATMRGAIHVEMQYGKSVEVKSLRLVREKSTASKWRIHPEDFAEMSKTAK
jgi:hypothetical protein